MWTTTGPGSSMGNPSGHYDVNYATNQPTTRYYYDGQMGFEDDYNPSGTVTQVNRYALGARGIDRIARTESGNTTLAYPLYDGHGNMRALLTRDGTEYDTGNWRTYDVWGSVRSGGSSADPKQGYVASIGHVSDGESSLIYMRARYYEPATGRFISEDPAMQEWNWYVYCGNEPLSRVDRDGKEWDNDNGYFTFNAALGVTYVALALMLAFPAFGPHKMDLSEKFIAGAVLIMAAFHFSEAIGETRFSESRFLRFMTQASAYIGFIAAILEGFKASKRWVSGFGKGVVLAAGVYSLAVLGMLVALYVE